MAKNRNTARRVEPKLNAETAATESVGVTESLPNDIKQALGIQPEAPPAATVQPEAPKAPEAPKIVAPDNTALPAPVAAAAITGIDECYIAATAKGGIFELEDALAEKTVSVAKTLKGIVDLAAEHANGDTKQTMAYFKAALAMAELHLKTNHIAKEEADKLERFLTRGTWATYSASTMQAVKAGFDPRSFPSLSAIWKARVEANQNQSKKGQQTGGQPAATPAATTGSNNPPPATSDAGKADAVAKGSAKIEQACIALLKAVKNADLAKHEDRVMNILNNATKEIVKLALPTPADKQ